MFHNWSLSGEIFPYKLLEIGMLKMFLGDIGSTQTQI